MSSDWYPLEDDECMEAFVNKYKEEFDQWCKDNGIIKPFYYYSEFCESDTRFDNFAWNYKQARDEEYEEDK